MNHCRLVALAVAAATVLLAAAAPDPVYAPLWLYNGGWQVTPMGATKPDQLLNECKLVGKFFACQQTVNGKMSALVVFIPREKPGQYYTQSLRPEGAATGRGELEINGDHWTYLGRSLENGKTKLYRTTNQFTGKNKIHYEQSESTDGEHWTVTGSGDEVRAARK